MPTERFLHLPEEKRRRITKAARDEMSRVPYDEVSINQIVKQAGIPRGSFYQYFSGKEDLLAYLLDGYKQGMLDKLGEALAASGGDVFYAINQLFDYTVEFGTQSYNLAFCLNIFASRQMHLQTTSEIIDMVRRENLMNQYWPQVSMKDWRKQDQQLREDLLALLIMVYRHAIEQTFSHITTKDEVVATFRGQLKIIQYGIMKELETQDYVQV